MDEFDYQPSSYDVLHYQTLATLKKLNLTRLLTQQPYSINAIH